MPELPEVETVRRGLLPMVGRRIVSVCLFRRDMLLPGSKTVDVARAMLQGHRLIGVERVGKQLALVADDRRALGIHLGMTGQVLIAPAQRPVATHDHARWILDDGLSATFRDPRRFGGLRAADSSAELFDTLGPDALGINAEQLKAGCGGSSRAIKAALLDQRVLAGVGNIYADESLFHAGVRPSKRCRRLSLAEFEAIAAAIRDILAAAIGRGGSTLRDYRKPDGQLGGAQALHHVYGRGGLPCVRCGVALRSGTIAQRTTVCCYTCQRG